MQLITFFLGLVRSYAGGEVRLQIEEAIVVEAGTARLKEKLEDHDFRVVGGCHYTRRGRETRR